MYAELHGDEVHVDKELFGDTFRRAPRLTPLEARAIRLALEFVGPMIAAGSSSPLDRVRAKLEEAFGQFDLAQTPTPQAGAEEDLVATLTRAIDRKRLVELEYLKPESTEVETRTIEPYGIERRLPHWYVHTWDVDRDAPRSYRLDRTRTAKLLTGAVRAAGGLRPVRAARDDERPDLVLARRRAAGRSRRVRVPLVDGAALSGASRRQRELARRRGALVPRRGGRARAARAAEARRRRRARPGAPAARGPGDRRAGSSSVNVEPAPGSEDTSSVPPCASATRSPSGRADSPRPRSRHDERQRDEADDRDPAFEEPQLHRRLQPLERPAGVVGEQLVVPVGVRLQHRPRLGSSAPVLPSATSAFRRSQRGSLRGT